MSVAAQQTSKLISTESKWACYLLSLLIRCLKFGQDLLCIM